jgi:hypothetical protein
MAYPPDPVAANKSNTTGMFNDHADHHNELAEAVNDVVEVLGVDPQGSALTTTERLKTLSYLGALAGPKLSGFHYDQNIGNSVATVSVAANQCVMAPLILAADFTFDEIGVSVSSASSSASVKTFIYASGNNFWPDQLVFESDPVAAPVAGFYGVSHTRTLSADTVYWVGARVSAVVSLRTPGTGGHFAFGFAGGDNITQFIRLLRNLTFATPLPTSWNFVSSDLATSNSPSIRMRAV